eukprot:2967182-Ditylum_brightwellii.AAC.1
MAALQQLAEIFGTATQQPPPTKAIPTLQTTPSLRKPIVPPAPAVPPPATPRKTYAPMTAPTTMKRVEEQRPVQPSPAPRVLACNDTWGSTGRQTRVLPPRK